MKMRLVLALEAAAVAVALASCSGSSGDSSSGGPATMNVHLVDAPGDYAHIMLNVQSVAIHNEASGWVTLGTPNLTVDLLALRNGVEQTLVTGASLPAGHYDQMRLVLGSSNTVTLGTRETHALMVRSGMQSSIKFPVSFDVEPGTPKDIFIDVDAHRSIHFHRAGHSGRYIFRPIVRAVDRAVAGSVSGTLRDGAGHGLPGVLVMAETLDANGGPVLVASAVTAADGTYTIGLLPLGNTYYVVSQPVVSPPAGAAVVYQTQASAGITLTEQAPLATFDAAFVPATVAGGVEVTFAQPVTLSATPDADDSVFVIQQLSAGGVPITLIIRSQPATVLDAAESASFGQLPGGFYLVYAERRVTDGAGNVTVTMSQTMPADLTLGGTLDVMLGFGSVILQ